ncbi:MAG: hypothetical protein JW955_23980 [Sedimentisphaerales bacterium]|nr:hypothetical protein [Sedimentisphaerales bacterium]
MGRYFGPRIFKGAAFENAPVHLAEMRFDIAFPGTVACRVEAAGHVIELLKSKDNGNAWCRVDRNGDERMIGPQDDIRNEVSPQEMFFLAEFGLPHQRREAYPFSSVDFVKCGKDNSAAKDDWSEIGVRGLASHPDHRDGNSVGGSTAAEHARRHHCRKSRQRAERVKHLSAGAVLAQAPCLLHGVCPFPWGLKDR